MLLLFVDTNLLLHYRRLEEIDWRALTPAKEITIVVCPVVIRELEKHKHFNPQHRLRKRSQDVVAALQSRAETGSLTLRDHVYLELSIAEPLLDFAAEQLRPELPDDWLLATLLERKRQDPSKMLAIATADFGLSLKAKQRGFDALRPGDKDKLSEEPDADQKRIAQLQAELTELKNAMPRLTVCFEGGHTLSAKLKPALIPSEQIIEQEIEKVRAKFPPLKKPTGKQKPIRLKTIGDFAKFEKLKKAKVELVYSEEVVNTYNAELKTFIEGYREYYRKLTEFENRRRRTLTFDLYLDNSGKRIAEDIDIHLHFSDGFDLFRDKDEAEPPAKPLEPAQPGTFRVPGLRMPNVPFINTAGHVGPPPNVSAPRIRRTNSYEVRVSVGKLKHGYQTKIGTFVVVFDSRTTAKPFQIQYNVDAANLPNPSVGELNVLVQQL